MNTTKLNNYPKETKLDLLRKELGLMDVTVYNGYMVYNLSNNAIAQRVEKRARAIIDMYGWPLTTKVRKYPFSTLEITEIQDPFLAAQSRLNEICLGVNGFERITEQLNIRHA